MLWCCSVMCDGAAFAMSLRCCWHPCCWWRRNRTLRGVGTGVRSTAAALLLMMMLLLLAALPCSACAAAVQQAPGIGGTQPLPWSLARVQQGATQVARDGGMRHTSRRLLQGGACPYQDMDLLSEWRRSSRRALVCGVSKRAGVVGQPRAGGWDATALAHAQHSTCKRAKALHACQPGSRGCDHTPSCSHGTLLHMNMAA